MQFQICENTGFTLRLGLDGPSGSGKTYTALKLATELGYERIGIIDTENKSARRYAKTFAKRFHALELDHFAPRDYIEAIKAAEAAGIEVLIIDSLSHAWMGRGGVLEMVDQSARRQARGNAPNSFSGWREVTPEHNRLVDALIHCPMHLIVTMRVKTEYVVEQDGRGKAAPRKVGLAPVQREGLEYEFDVMGDLSPDHDLVITKSRCPAIADQVISKPGAELAKTLRAWLEGAEPRQPAPAGPGNITVQGARSGQGAPPEAPPRAPAAADGEDARARELEEIAIIQPWLDKITAAEATGSEDALESVRQDMNLVLKRKTRAQGETLRRALETARAAIKAAKAEQAAEAAAIREQP